MNNGLLYALLDCPCINLSYDVGTGFIGGAEGIGIPLGPSPDGLGIVGGFGAGAPGICVAFGGIGGRGPIPVGAIMKLLAIAKLLALFAKLPAKLDAAGRREVFEGFLAGGVSTHSCAQKLGSLPFLMQV